MTAHWLITANPEAQGEAIAASSWDIDGLPQSGAVLAREIA
jgi:hypothetical protein